MNNLYKKDNKVKKNFTIHESVWNAVAKRAKQIPVSVSTLIENLLISWTHDFDKLNDKEAQAKRIMKKVEAYEQKLKEEVDKK